MTIGSLKVSGTGNHVNHLAGVRIGIKEPAIRAAVNEALARLSPHTSIPTLEAIVSRKRSSERSLGGLTKRTTYERTFRLSSGETRNDEVVVQRIELYSEILLQLSEKSRLGVVAHELAHAWLNDNIGPEESKLREEMADSLARRWGFGEELSALAEETE